MRSGAWLALEAAGFAAALQLIDAGPLIHYQHYRLPPAALHDPVLRWWLLVVVLQAVLVAGGLAKRRAAIVEWVRLLSRPWRIAAAIAASLCVAAALSRDPRFFVFELGFGAFIQLVNAGNILLFAWALPETAVKAAGRRLDAWLGGGQSQPIKVDRFALLVAAWVVLAAGFLCGLVYQRHPHVADEVAYLYNARYFAAGQLTMPPPPLPAAFEVDLMDNQPDRWFSSVPLGWPAMLAAGEFLHAAWLVNPVLAGLNVLLVYLLIGELYSRRIARISVLLLAISPWHLFLAMSYMNHTITLTCALLAFWGITQARRTGLARWALAGGFGVGAISLIRPLDGLIVGVLAAGWALGWGSSRLKFSALAALAAGTFLTGALALPYNKLLTGSATKSPLTSYTETRYGAKSIAYGFGPERGIGWPIDPYPGHTPFEALILAELNGNSLTTELFGWSTGSLFLIAIMVFLGDLRRSDYLMLAVIAGVILAYVPYWTNGGPDFGARYWFLIIVPCVALSARGLEWLEQRFKSPGRDEARATIAIAALCGLALLTYVPWRSLDKYHDYLRMRADVRQLASRYHFGRSLVLVRGERFPDYASAAIYNPLDLHADAPIYVWDRSAGVRRQILSLYPDRPVWVLEGPSVTHAGFRIAAGPLSAENIR